MNFHEGQLQVYNDPARFKVVCAGRRWGKSSFAIQTMMYFALLRPKSKVIYFAPTISQARDIVWNELKTQIYQTNIQAGDPNESRLEINIKNIDQNGNLLPTTSSIWLRGTENIESARGNKIDFLVVDEVASMRNWTYVWNEVLRPTLTDVRGEAIFISTPRGMNFFYDLFNKEQKDTDYKSFRFTTYDNPYIPVDEIEKAKLELSQESFAQEYLAEFVSVSGQFYKEFDVVSQFVKCE